MPVVPVGCNLTTDPSDCVNLRGGRFDKDLSSTWIEKGLYNIPLSAEAPLGLSANGDFGFDTVLLSCPGCEGVTINSSVIGGIATKDLFIGTLGLTPDGVNFTNFDSPVPGVLTSFKDAGHIGSRSWSYTAGAYYTPKQTLGSLTFGGYDASRFVPNDLNIIRSPAGDRDLLVGLQSITSGTNSLLPTGIIALIDSTVSPIWLPMEACQRFEDVFGLVWDNDFGLYLVNDSLHDRLLADNPTISFTIGSTATSNPVVEISMPYGSFDLTASWPLVGNNTLRYFPLRRAENATQYVLGRTFLQQAYLTVDYDRNSFSVSQALFPDTNVPQDLVAISSPKNPKGSLGVGAIVGIVVAVVCLVCAALLVGFLCYRRRNSARSKSSRDTIYQPELDGTVTDLGKNGFSTTSTMNEKDGTRWLQEIDSPSRQEIDSVSRQEMDSPSRQEIDSFSRQEMDSSLRQEIDSVSRQEMEALPRYEAPGKVTSIQRKTAPPLEPVIHEMP